MGIGASIIVTLVWDAAKPTWQSKKRETSIALANVHMPHFTKGSYNASTKESCDTSERERRSRIIQNSVSDAASHLLPSARIHVSAEEENANLHIRTSDTKRMQKASTP